MTIEFPGGGGGGGGLSLNIPTTNLGDTEEIRQWFVAPAGATTTVVAVTLLNEAGNAPAGLDAVVYDFTNGVEVYRGTETYSEPEALTLEAGATYYFALENQTGGTQNANGILEMTRGA